MISYLIAVEDAELDGEKSAQFIFECQRLKQMIKQFSNQVNHMREGWDSIALRTATTNLSSNDENQALADKRYPIYPE